VVSTCASLRMARHGEPVTSGGWLCLCVVRVFAGAVGLSGERQLMEQVDGLQGDDNVRIARKGLAQACNASLDR
jgi:hypothetical protein